MWELVWKAADWSDEMTAMRMSYIDAMVEECACEICHAVSRVRTYNAQP